MILAFDVGGTSVKYGVAETGGRFLFQDSFDTPKAGLKDFMEKTGEVFCRAGKRWDIEGAAFSFPGEVHSREGIIRGISAIPYIHGVRLKMMLEERFGGLPVTMANDANCAALGEMWKGVARDRRNVVFVICGTGIGGAVIEHGKLYKGVTMNRGEFGNFPMGGFEDGTMLTWSDYTLEKQARKYAVQRGMRTGGNAGTEAAAETEASGTEAAAGTEVVGTVTGKDLAELSRLGDSLARHLMEEFYHWMAVGCIILEFSFDPEMIAIGGGISANPDIIRGIRQKADEMLEGQRPGYLRPYICVCTNGNQANLYGAVYYYLHQDRME